MNTLTGARETELLNTIYKGFGSTHEAGDNCYYDGMIIDYLMKTYRYKHFTWLENASAEDVADCVLSNKSFRKNLW